MWKGVLRAEGRAQEVERERDWEEGRGELRGRLEMVAEKKLICRKTMLIVLIYSPLVHSPLVLKLSLASVQPFSPAPHCLLLPLLWGSPASHPRSAKITHFNSIATSPFSLAPVIPWRVGHFWSPSSFSKKPPSSSCQDGFRAAFPWNHWVINLGKASSAAPQFPYLWTSRGEAHLPPRVDVNKKCNNLSEIAYYAACHQWGPKGSGNGPPGAQAKRGYIAYRWFKNHYKAP